MEYFLETFGYDDVRRYTPLSAKTLKDADVESDGILSALKVQYAQVHRAWRLPNGEHVGQDDTHCGIVPIVRKNHGTLTFVRWEDA